MSGFGCGTQTYDLQACLFTLQPLLGSSLAIEIYVGRGVKDVLNYTVNGAKLAILEQLYEP